MFCVAKDCGASAGWELVPESQTLVSDLALFLPYSTYTQRLKTISKRGPVQTIYASPATEV